MHSHTHTHTHKHTTCMHTHTHSRTHACVHIHSYVIEQKKKCHKAWQPSITKLYPYPAGNQVNDLTTTTSFYQTVFPPSSQLSNQLSQNPLNTHLTSVALVLITSQDKVSWRPNCNRTWYPDDAKNSRTPDLKKTKSMVVNKTVKVKVHITDNQSWNSCRKVASDHEFAFCWVKEPTKEKQTALWPCTIHGHWLQPKQMHRSTRLSFSLNHGLNFVGK